MGVYIKVMEKPENCQPCIFNMADCRCWITHGEIDRHDYLCDVACPIVEIPTPHGRLIDADKLAQSAQVRFWGGARNVDINKAPTVIESEE